MIRPGMHPPFPPRGPEPFMHGPRPGMGPGPEHDPGFGPRPRFPMGPNGPFPGHMPGPPDGHMPGPPSKFAEDKDLYITICSFYLKVLCIILAYSAAVFSGKQAVNISSVFESKGRLGSVKVLVVGEGKG